MKYALHSVSYSGCWEGQTKLGVEEVIDKVADLGYDGIELAAKRPHASPLDLDDDDRKRVKNRAAEMGVEIPILAGYQDFSEPPGHGDMAHGEKELVYLRETCRMAADLGAPLVRIYSGFLHPGSGFGAQWKTIVSRLKEAVKIAEGHGVVLAMQNHSEMALHHRDVLEMVGEVGSDFLKVALDAPYVHMCGIPQAEAVRDVGSLIVYSTASDFNMWIRPHGLPSAAGAGGIGHVEFHAGRVTALGDGDVDYKGFITALNEIGYDKWLAYEMCSAIPGFEGEKTLDEYAVKSLNFLKKTVSQCFS